MNNILNFYKGKKVFVTGYTGFKGTWLTKILVDSGANVCGYSLKASEEDLYSKISLDKKIDSNIGDIRNFENLKSVFEKFKPEIVFHLAAQPIVKRSYKEPIYTYQTNVIGTLNLLECIRLGDSVKSFVNITTDKVYENDESAKAFKETDRLNGFDPYSNSKSCSELITSSYVKSFLKDKNIAVSTVRAGNVIGGGDYAENRIIPDCVRAAKNGKKIQIRNPNSVRPYQHVLEADFVYLMIAKKQYEDIKFAGSYNVGPDDENIINTQKLVQIFCNKWGENLEYYCENDNGPHEAGFLKLDCTKLKETFNWQSKWKIEEAVENVVEFEKSDNFENVMEKQIQKYMT